MGRQVKSSLNHQIDLVSVDVGATAWNSAKANDAFVNCFGRNTPRAFYCKGNVMPMPGLVLRHADGFSAANLPPI